MNEEFYILASQLISMKKDAFKQYKNQIDIIINNNIKDKDKIEHLIDYTIDLIYDEESYNYCIKICNYLKEIDLESGSFYLKLVKEGEL